MNKEMCEGVTVVLIPEESTWASFLPLLPDPGRGQRREEKPRLRVT